MHVETPTSRRKQRVLLLFLFLVTTSTTAAALLVSFPAASTFGVSVASNARAVAAALRSRRVVVGLVALFADAL